MNVYAVYEEGGRIIQTLSNNGDSTPVRGKALLAPEGLIFDDVTHYVINEEITLRPFLTISHSISEIKADGTDISIITGIPLGGTVTSNGTTMTADGNPIEFVTDIPGEHKLKITLWPYQDEEVTINAI